MRKIPAIDILDGQCVRLRKGNYGEKTFYGAAVTVARNFYDSGAKSLHVVDLDGAKDGLPKNSETVAEIVKMGFEVQLGGGIRTEKAVESYLELGVHSLILGSLAVDDPQRAEEIICHFGMQRFVLAFDVKFIDGCPYVHTRGWKENSTCVLWDLLEMYDRMGIPVLVTDISRDGMMEGPNFSLYQELKARTNSPVIASGGVRGVQDIELLQAAGVDGVVLGRSLLDGMISIESLKNGT